VLLQTICSFTALSAGLFLAYPAAAQVDDTALLRTQIQELNRQLEVSVAAGSDRQKPLLDQRAALLVRLMEDDPLALGSLALPSSIAAQAGGMVESAGEWTGVLEVAVADDFERHRSRTEWYLQEHGRRWQLHLSATPHQSAGSAIKVAGVSIAGHIAVSAILAPTGAAVVSPQQCTTIGQQNVAVLMLTMPSSPSLPDGYDAASLRQIFFGSPSDGAPGTASLNGAWNEMSYGKTSAAGQVFGPFALGQDFDCTDPAGIQTAALNAASGTVDFTQYTHIAMYFPSASCPSYQGKDSQGCWSVQLPNSSKVNTSVGWFPAFPGTQPSLGVIAHEFGHALGLGHSSGEAFNGQALGPIDSLGVLTEYGDPFAVMGNSDAGAGNVWGQYAGPHKSVMLNWLTFGEDVVEVSAAGSFPLRPLETQANPRILRILRDSLTGSWLWLEYRQPLGDIDPGLQQISGANVFDGVLIHNDDPNLNGTYTDLLDFNPESPAVFSNAALVPGSSWSDPYSLMTLSVASPTLQGITVNVSYDQPCAALQYSATSFSAAGGGGSVTVTAPSSCSWTASSSVAWLHLTGTTAGQGNGVVTFSADANSTSLQQYGYLTVQRQSTQILERGTNLTVLSVTPNSGSGASSQFTFQITDASGNADISTVQVQFTGSYNCVVRANQNGGAYYLELGQPDGSTSGPLPMGVAGQSIANSLCTVSSLGSGVTGSGSQLQLVLQMSFPASFGGSHRILGGAITRSGDNLPGVPLGYWTVPGVQQPALTVTASEAGAPFRLDGGTVYQAPATLYLTAGSQHTITWLSAPPVEPNARYTFQNWSDASTANPRTITAPSSDVTYTANLSAQYLLSVAIAPALAGTVSLSPSSPDGFYDSGTAVAVSATQTAGYVFTGFSGDIPPITPAVVTMLGPRTITANFGCNLAFSSPLPIPAGPGPISGLLAWTLGSACSASMTNDSPWLTLGQPTTFYGLTLIPFSVLENLGESRTATVTITVNQEPWQTVLTQDAAGTDRPNVMSISPASGSARSAVFTIQAYDAAGYDNINSLNLNFNGLDDQYCTVVVIAGQTPSVNVISPGEAVNGSFPGTGTTGTSICQINGPGSSISGTGKIRTVTLDMSFQSAFGGPRTVTGVAGGSAEGLSGSLVLLGTWVVPTSPPALGIAETSDALSVSAGSSIGFTVSTSNSSAAGTGGASNATLTDTLPVGGGLNWIVSPPYSGPGSCSVTGTLGAQMLACSLGSLAPGASASVHLSSATAPASCQTYTNTAILAADGVSPLSSNAATVTVTCPALIISAPSSLPQGAVDISYVPIAVTATGGSGIYTWSATGLPSGLSIDKSNGTISGVPAAIATAPSNVDIRVTDSSSTVADRVFTLAVSAYSPCDLDLNGTFTVSDVRQIINEALGVAVGSDHMTQSGSINVGDIQIVLNAALAKGCAAQ
jgi:hypothetical protein